MNTPKVTAVNSLRPRARTSTLVELKVLASYVATRANLSVSDVSHALEELHNAVIFFCSIGHSVKLEGLGIFRPDLELDGSKTIHFRMDQQLIRTLNAVPFVGVIEHGENIGKTSDELTALWNELHPEAPVAP